MPGAGLAPPKDNAQLKMSDRIAHRLSGVAEHNSDRAQFASDEGKIPLNRYHNILVPSAARCTCFCDLSF